MAQRPIFIPCTADRQLVQIKHVDFVWHPGMAASQKKKSVASLHSQACKTLRVCRSLEVSTKSDDPVGVALSAFNLKFTTKKNNLTLSVESAFQGSKVFENGGPYTDLYLADSRDAKRDPRLKESGRLVSFRFFGVEWPLVPPTAFYDWLYISALMKNLNAAELLDQYDSFTDIEFNPERSLNCQAHSIALYVSLKRVGLLEKALPSKENFLDTVSDLRGYKSSPFGHTASSLFERQGV